MSFPHPAPPSSPGMAPLRSVSLGSPSLMLTGEKSPIEGAPALSGTPGLLPGGDPGSEL